MDIVLDEWLPEYMRNRDKVKITMDVLQRIYDKCDAIAVLEGSPFIEKMRKIFKDYSHWNDPGQIEVVRFFTRCFWTNSLKLHLHTKGESSAIPEEIKTDIPDEDDIYLFETLFLSISAGNRGIILTTDARLKSKSASASKYVVLLDYFLENYPFKEGEYENG